MKKMTTEDRLTLDALVKMGFKKLNESKLYFERASVIAKQYGLRLGDLEASK